MGKSNNKLLIRNVATISCLWPDRYDQPKIIKQLFEKLCTKSVSYTDVIIPTHYRKSWQNGQGEEKCELKNHIKHK